MVGWLSITILCVTSIIVVVMISGVSDMPNKGDQESLPTSMLFIDGTNFDRVCREKLGRNDIDFEKLLPAVSRGTRLLHTYYVTAPYKREINEMWYRVQTGMLNHLRRIPDVTVDLQQHRYRDVRCNACGVISRTPREKGTDVSVASFLVEAAVTAAAEQIILMANDADYAPAFKLDQCWMQKRG